MGNLTQFNMPPLILAMLLWLLNNSVSLSNQSPNITTDQLALLALKAHVTDPQALLATNWSAAASVCNWIGVTCGPRHRRVIALSLANMGLTGTIPPQLGNLSFLAWLNTYNNSFRGSLPHQLSNLRRLKLINLSNNSFSGEIPPWFGSFTQLQGLILDGNMFMGVIPNSLCYLPKLERLSLSGNNLQGQIPIAIDNLCRLKLLYLDQNRLSGSIPSSVFNISSLQEIDLSGNQLSGTIPSMKRNVSSSLQIIDFGKNKLTGHLRPEMFDHTLKLRGLFLSWNQLSGTIPTGVFKCKELEILSLSNNNLEGSVPREVKNLTLLRFLYLGVNNLQGEIPRQIGEIKSLQILSFRSCNLTGPIPSAIGNLTFLRILDFAFNNLTGTIPFEIGNLQNLQMLSLAVNSISGPIPIGIFNSSIRTIISLSSNRVAGVLPSTMGLWLPQLEQLQLAGNQLSGLIPTSISNASHLTILDLSRNSFSGYIPHTLGKLRDLQSLNLGYNNISSKPSSQEMGLLSSLANCQGLQSLGLDGNPLINTELHIPLIGNLSKSLQEFSVSGCNIRGSIPREIGNLSSLVTLAMGSNQLMGTIPSTVGGLRELQGFSFERNKLEGPIPSEFCHLEKLGFLYLHNNKLSGSVPACFGDMTSLRSLILGSNKLNSSVPASSLTRLKDMLELDLSSNSLTGPLPTDIGKLKAVTDVDLSGNQFSGNIPTSIGELLNLNSLSLSGNRLQGLIPQSFGDLIALEFLDLSRNNLSGTIPRSLEKVSYLKYFNVSFNRLGGEIPNAGPFLNYSFKSFMGNEALCSGALRFHLPPCTTSLSLRRSKPKFVKLLKYVLPTITSAILVMALAIIFIRRSRERKAKSGTTEHGENVLLPLAAWKRVSYQQLAQATDGFCESKLLGVGSFGSVYHGTLPEGIRIAVKVFNLEVDGAFKSFDVECEVLRNIRHRNLVKIISSCCNTDFKALVFEFMPNGSLERWLYSHNYFVNMMQRINMMIDVASALEYLHHGHATPIVHCDVKPSNVLVDEDMVAHLSDFGISKLLGDQNAMILTMTLATIGYMAPEYGTEGVVSTKGDVYSFGILLLETFTRKRPVDETFGGEMNLRSWVQTLLLSTSTSTQVIDSNLLSAGGREDYAIQVSALSVLQLALECSAELPEERIDMKEVAVKLKKIKLNFLKDVEWD